MKTSVALASYNGEKYIREQLQSILDQTVLPDEIVISDDGSDDLTVKIVRDIISENQNKPVKIKLIHNNESHGIVANFENAIKNTEKEVIFLCDQDDIWFPNKIELILKVMEKHNAGVVCHNAQILKQNQSGAFEPIDQYVMKSNSFASDGCYSLGTNRNNLWSAFYSCFIQGMCLCAKREYLISLLPFSRGSVHDIWIEFCATADNQMIAYNEPLAYYRIHDSNALGLNKFSRKRSFIDRIRTFDTKGKDSLYKQYLWYKDTCAYLKQKQITLNNPFVIKLADYFGNQRLDCVKAGKTEGTIKLVKAYRSGAYRIDGRILLLHDLYFLWRHSLKYRRKYISVIQKHQGSTRSNAS